MCFKLSAWLLLLCGISIASTALAQTEDTDKSSKSQLTATLKDKIQKSLDTADEDSLVTYNHEGQPLKHMALASNTFENYDSLSELVKKDPIATCQDPKSLKPPPQCVVCKNGKIICTRAKFGVAASAAAQGSSGSPDQ